MSDQMDRRAVLGATAVLQARARESLLRTQLSVYQQPGPVSCVASVWFGSVLNRMAGKPLY